MAKLYTKQGDKGLTSIIGNEKLSKSHVRIEAYGDIDELNSLIGVLYHFLRKENQTELKNIQNLLFEIGSDLASVEPRNTITDEDVHYLEHLIDSYQSKTDPLQAFILPGGSQAASWLHYTRTVVRRCERRIVALNDEIPVNEFIIPWINRLSDWFFALARYYNHTLNIPDIEWKSRE